MKMAIVKVTYTKNKKAAKATIRYITHRPGKDGERMARQIYGIDGALEKSDAYEMVDEADRGVVFFRIVISPDPKQEDTKQDLYLWQITEQTMLRLENRLGKQVPFIAVEHNDHTSHRHVHLLACVKARLAPKDFQALRQAATAAALFQRKELDLARDAKAQALEEAQWA